MTRPRRKHPPKPAPPAVPADLPPFDPVPVKPRNNGWTPGRQRAFIAALAERGWVSQAAEAVHMTPESAYQLRRRPDAESFRQAWDAALARSACAAPEPLPLTLRGLMHALEADARRMRAAHEASGLTNAEIDAIEAELLRNFRAVP